MLVALVVLSCTPASTPAGASASATPTLRETPIELLTPTPSPSLSVTPSPSPDPVTAYRNATLPLIDQLYKLGQAVTAACPGTRTTPCRDAFQSLFDASASATTTFDTLAYPPCMVGFHTVVRATAAAYHNAAIQGLASLDDPLARFDYSSGLETIAVEEHTITGTRLFDTPLECSR